jgi:SAM-dependent methyltransferase
LAGTSGLLSKDRPQRIFGSLKMSYKATEISKAFREHYAKKLEQYGPTAAGVDWIKEATAELTYFYALKLIRSDHPQTQIKVLDVGCGYGGLLTYAEQHGFDLDYTGIDIVPEMIEHGKKLHPQATFLVGDFLDLQDVGQYDYVICNGAMTIKLKASTLEMHHYVDAMLRKMFGAAKVGLSFNVMTNRVNFQVENSYYRSPVETLAFCLSELSENVVLDHDHPRYQFWTYVYRA